MSASGHKPNSFEKNELIPDALQLYVNTKIYEGWEDVEITRELNSCASDFQLGLVDIWEQNKEPWRLAPGEAVHMHAGGKSILTGYIDKVEASISSNERKITVSGRSKTCDLVDCSVLEEKGNQFNGLTLKEIVSKVLEPYKLKVVFYGDVGDAYTGVVLNQGETVFALLDRLARMRKLLMYPSVEGVLIFAPPGVRRSSCELIQGVNILSGHVTVDYSNRFSLYKVKANTSNLAFMKTLGINDAPVSEATDEAVSRYRPTLLIHEVTGDNEVVEDRAAYESSLRAAQAVQLEIEVVGWFQAPGRLWEINEEISVDAGFLGIRRKMLIKKIVYQKNNSGTTAKITLIIPEALDFKVKKKKKKGETDLSWLKIIDDSNLSKQSAQPLSAPQNDSEEGEGSGDDDE